MIKIIVQKAGHGSLFVAKKMGLLVKMQARKSVYASNRHFAGCYL